MAEYGCGYTIEQYLPSAAVLFMLVVIWRAVAHLHAVIGLLKARARHGLRSGLLAARPDTGAIGRLLDGGGQGSFAGDLGRSSFLCCRRHGRVQLTGCGGERAPGECALARKAVGRP